MKCILVSLVLLMTGCASAPQKEVVDGKAKLPHIYVRKDGNEVFFSRKPATLEDYEVAKMACIRRIEKAASISGYVPNKAVFKGLRAHCMGERGWDSFYYKGEIKK